MDDFGNRSLKSLGIILGGYLFIYFLIVMTGQHRFGVSALIYQGMNFLFMWLARIVLISFLGFILFQGGGYYFKAKAKKKREELETQEKLQQQLINEEARTTELRKKETRIKEELEKEKQRLIEFEKHQLEEEQYLLNRSAQKANDDALKHFL